jgi:transcriptional regulator with XRE-family HTH domain
MGRSLRVRPEHLESVKQKLKQRGYAGQQDLAEELQLSRSTLSNYLSGRSVPHCRGSLDRSRNELGLGRTGPD